MAEDRKFKFENGRFVNRVSGEEIPDDEPVIIFRARDWHALAVLDYYHGLVEDEHHQQAVRERIEEFVTFKQTFPHRMKEPGITGDFALRSGSINIIIPENQEEAEDEIEHHSHDHPGPGHSDTPEQRLEAVEHRTIADEERITKIMADIDTLNSVLGGIASDAATISADFKNLEAELQAAQAAAANNQPIDLTNSILMARNAQAALDAIVASAGSVAPAAGDTGGAPAGDTGGAPAGDTGGAPAGDTGGAPAGDTGGAPAGDTGGAPADGSGSGDLPPV